MTDDDYKRFLFEYSHEGAEWVLEIRARDISDAKARLAAIPLAKLCGEVVLSGPILEPLQIH